MRIRLLEDDAEHGFVKNTEREVSHEVGISMISKGLAVIVSHPEKAIDRDAGKALKEARRKDGPKE